MWTDGGLGGTFNPDPFTPGASYTPPASFTGQAFLTWTVTGPCTSQATVTITVVPALTGTVTAPSMCVGSNATGSITTNSQSATYQWSVVTNGGSASIVGSNTGPTVNLHGDVSGPAVLECLVNSVGCVKTFTKDFNVFVTPAVPVVTAPASAIGNTPGLVASTPAVAGVTYLWSISNGTITSGQGTNQIIFTAGQNGITVITVIETNSNGCSRASAPANVAIQTSGGGNCAGGNPFILCLNNDRFQAKVHFKNYNDGSQGDGHAISFNPIPDDSGYFWFFSAPNMELLVKVLDARATNGKFWVFYGALTDVEFDLTITDTVNGNFKVYHNAAHNLASVGDTTAFPGTPRGGVVPMFGEGELERALADGRVHSAEELLASDSDTPAAALEPTTTNLFSTCIPNATTLCLTDNGRFQLTTAWKNYNNNTTGVGTAVPITTDSGIFWFFNQKNVEMAVKVLNAIAVNNRYWVLYGALSDVEYTITITDVTNGAVKTYFNSAHVFHSVSDINAFAP